MQQRVGVIVKTSLKNIKWAERVRAQLREAAKQCVNVTLLHAGFNSSPASVPAAEAQQHTAEQGVEHDVNSRSDHSSS